MGKIQSVGLLVLGFLRPAAIAYGCVGSQSLNLIEERPGHAKVEPKVCGRVAHRRTAGHGRRLHGRGGRQAIHFPSLRIPLTDFRGLQHRLDELTGSRIGLGQSGILQLELRRLPPEGDRP